VPVRPSPPAVLDRGDRLDADPGTLGQRILSEVGVPPVATQQLTELLGATLALGLLSTNRHDQGL
jgi:hypothetical protein